MKINKTKSKRFNKKVLIPSLILAVILLLSLGALTYVNAFGGNLFGWTKTSDNTTTDSTNNKPATPEQIQNGNDIKKNNVDSTNSSDKGSTTTPSPSTPTPTPTSPTSSKQATIVTITAANQNGSVFQIRSSINTLTSNGTCTLTLSKNGQTVTKTAAVQALASESTCQGFDIPTSELSPGTWSLTLHFENSQYQGDAQRNITIQ